MRLGSNCVDYESPDCFQLILMPLCTPHPYPPPRYIRISELAVPFWQSPQVTGVISKVLISNELVDYCLFRLSTFDFMDPVGRLFASSIIRRRAAGLSQGISVGSADIWVPIWELECVLAVELEARPSLRDCVLLTTALNAGSAGLV
jgi:hypothetical protein